MQLSAFFCILLQKNETFSHSFMFFAKERNILCILLRSLQKNVCKRTLHSLRSFMFFRKEWKRTHRSFGSHKLPKTWKKNVKELCVLQKNAKERCIQNGKERVALKIMADFRLTVKVFWGLRQGNIDRWNFGILF